MGNGKKRHQKMVISLLVLNLFLLADLFTGMSVIGTIKAWAGLHEVDFTDDSPGSYLFSYKTDGDHSLPGSQTSRNEEPQPVSPGKPESVTEGEMQSVPASPSPPPAYIPSEPEVKSGQTAEGGEEEQTPPPKKGEPQSEPDPPPQQEPKEDPGDDPDDEESSLRDILEDLFDS